MQVNGPNEVCRAELLTVERYDVTVDLTADERELLAQGLLQWGGPAAPTDALAAAMGFVDVPALLLQALSATACMELVL